MALRRATNASATTRGTLRGIGATRVTTVWLWEAIATGATWRARTHTDVEFGRQLCARHGTGGPHRLCLPANASPTSPTHR